MKKILPVVIFLCFVLVSCQKEIPDYVHVQPEPIDTTTESDIRGVWNFVSINVEATASVDVDFFGINQKTVTYSNYTTTNNSGTIIIGDSVVSSTNVGYTIDYTAKSYQYQNNILLDSLDFPIQLTYTSLNSSAKYKLIGTDSIYYPEGSFATVPVEGLPDSLQAGPSGQKYILTGNTLTFFSNIYKDTVVDNFGSPVHQVEIGTASMVLQRP